MEQPLKAAPEPEWRNFHLCQHPLGIRFPLRPVGFLLQTPAGFWKCQGAKESSSQRTMDRIWGLNLGSCSSCGTALQSCGGPGANEPQLPPGVSELHLMHLYRLPSLSYHIQPCTAASWNHLPNKQLALKSNIKPWHKNKKLRNDGKRK